MRRWSWALVLLISPSLAIAQSEWTLHRTADGLHPSAEEQEMLWLMNRG